MSKIEKRPIRGYGVCAYCKTSFVKRASPQQKFCSQSCGSTYSALVKHGSLDAVTFRGVKKHVS